MKHWLVFAILGATLAWLILKPSPLDQLSKRPSAQSLAQAVEPGGNTFVEVPDAVLPVTPHYFAVPHRTTVVIFHDLTCPACLRLDRDLQDFTKLRPDVAIRKIHINLDGNAYYRAIGNFRWPIFLMPCVLIFDEHGKLIAADHKTSDDGGELLSRWMQREAERAMTHTAQAG